MRVPRCVVLIPALVFVADVDGDGGGGNVHVDTPPSQLQVVRLLFSNLCHEFRLVNFALYASSWCRP